MKSNQIHGNKQKRVFLSIEITRTNKGDNKSWRKLMKSFCPWRNLRIQLRRRLVTLMATWTSRSHFDREKQGTGSLAELFPSSLRGDETFAGETSGGEYFTNVRVYLLALRRKMGKKYREMAEAFGEPT